MRAAAATILLLASISCHGDPYSGDYLRDEPSRADLVGSYELERGPAARLEIRGDGSFALSEVPAALRMCPDCDSSGMRHTGTWKLDNSDGWWMIVFTSRQAGPVYRSWDTPAMLRGEAPSYLVHFIVGDPDVGEALLFRRMTG